jgi:hypothetical protein
VRHVARMEQMKKAYKILVREPKWKVPLVRPRSKLEKYIRMDLMEIG